MVGSRLLALLPLVLIAGCTGRGSTPAPPPLPRPPAPISMSYQRIYGTELDPVTDRISRALRGITGLIVAPDVIAFHSFDGCENRLLAPVRLVHVDARRVSWSWREIGTGPDCTHANYGFIRFSRPVFDMQHPVEVTSNLSAFYGSRKIVHDVARPASGAPQWVSSAGPLPDWAGTGSFRPPRCLWDRNATNLEPCQETSP